MWGPEEWQATTASCTRAGPFLRRPDKQLTEDPHSPLQQLALLRKENKKQKQSYLKNTQNSNTTGNAKHVKTVEIRKMKHGSMTSNILMSSHEKGVFHFIRDRGVYSPFSHTMNCEENHAVHKTKEWQSLIWFHKFEIKSEPTMDFDFLLSCF